jgi:hypothetical protein
MSRVHYVGKNGEPPPLTELEREKLKGQQLANDISQTRLARLRRDLLERREVVFVVENALVILRQQVMRLPSLVCGELRRSSLSREQLFAIRMSMDNAAREFLSEVVAALGKAGDPQEAIAEIVDEPQPSQKEIDAAARRKARTNTKRRERRKVKSAS